MTSRRMWLIAGAVWAAALALYLRTLAPTITWANFGADGGDLISAAYFAGVPHPTGYPTYVTLGQLFTRLPVGSIAFRLNFMSALCLSGAAALITLGLWRAMPSPRAGVAALGGLSFAAAPAVWGQATIAEVYALNAWFVAALSALLVPIVLQPDRSSARSLAAAFFLWGIGLGNHVTLVFLAPLVFAALIRAARFTRRLLLITRCTLPFVLGLCIYLLIPIRAAAQPPINWLGDVTGPRLAAFLGGELYRPYALGAPLSEYPDRAAALARLVVDQFGPIGLLLIVIGLEGSGRLPRRAAIALGVVIALYTIFAVGYRPPDWPVYLIPVWLFAAWLSAYGAHRLIAWRRVGPGAARYTFYALALVLVPGLIAATNFAAHDLSGDHRAGVFAREVWQAAPVGAILVTHDDAPTFTLWYYQLVEGQRRDTTIVDQRLAAYDWYAPMLRAQNAPDAAPVLPPIDPDDTWLDRLRAANVDRVVCDLQTEPVEWDCD